MNNVKSKLESCPICHTLMCFERKTDDMPHEYEVCNRCGKHICISCAKTVGETPYCPDCFNTEENLRLIMR